MLRPVALALVAIILYAVFCYSSAKGQCPTCDPKTGVCTVPTCPAGPTAVYYYAPPPVTYYAAPVYGMPVVTFRRTFYYRPVFPRRRLFQPYPGPWEYRGAVVSQCSTCQQ